MSYGKNPLKADEKIIKWLAYNYIPKEKVLEAIEKCQWDEGLGEFLMKPDDLKKELGLEKVKE